MRSKELERIASSFTVRILTLKKLCTIVKSFVTKALKYKAEFVCVAMCPLVKVLFP